MKMEVLSVQNQFQGQFGVIGSTKVKDWTSPLTPPPSHHHHYSNSNNKQSSIDIVDGHHHHHHRTTMSSPQAMHNLNLNHHHLNHHHLNHHHHHHLNHHLQATTNKLSRTNRQTTNYSDNNINNSSSNITTNATNLSSSNNTYNTITNNNDNSTTNSNNITTNPTISGSQITTTTTNSTTTTTNNRYNSNLICMTDDDASVNALSIRLQSELRAAKSRHLACTEVSLPWDLTPRIAAEIIRVSEKEPCGIRGCTIYIEFEDEPSNTRRIASMKVDPNTVPTFELYLTLKHDKSGWTSLLPQFIKNLTKSSTILISPDFSLTKNKLYHSSSE
ncbi:protein charybde-like [Episyrphus balteatus]|uniref:protein charybde-like n=1 Tax=Episyrphus balteatus TaxID=286459 RepID=UPI00248569F4|nr:protein charybde-like [Episyrphus balteatus]